MLDPENVDNPMIPPQDYDVRPFGRVLELQNRDLWIQPTDLSWHFPILVTIREMPFKSYRGRSSEKLKAREEKIEEAKKKTKRGEDAWSDTEWKSSSWSWQLPTTWASSSSSSCQQWNPEQTHERSDWQSADWNSSDQARKTTAWQTHFLWQ